MDRKGLGDMLSKQCLQVTLYYLKNRMYEGWFEGNQLSYLRHSQHSCILYRVGIYIAHNIVFQVGCCCIHRN